MSGDEVCLYHVIPELWPIGEVSPKELKFLPEAYVGKVQVEENINYTFGIIIMNLKKH